jgi:glycine/D-amino acid oxidase-like deaminating enzyme
MANPPLNHMPIWLEVPAITGTRNVPSPGEIVVVGSGLTGVSVAYWLLKCGFSDITIVDDKPLEAASFRNCGHILHGTVESMAALAAIHGIAKAKEIWGFSIGLCDLVGTTIRELGIDADYKQDGYLVMAIDEVEDREIADSVHLLTDCGFQSDYVPKEELHKLGFRNVFGGRFERGSAQAHPVKFRNGLLAHCLRRGVKYFSECKVTAVDEIRDKAVLTINGRQIPFEAAVIGANAYSPLISEYFAAHRLVEPFRGQIIASKPLRTPLPVAYPHSFDHGYEYALRSSDNRLIIGGWRNNSQTRELGSYDLQSNPAIDLGLMEFVKDHYQLDENPIWEYSWTGIMAASRTGFPFIGPTPQPRVFACSGYTGHGFSWAHGSAKLLADMMAGNPVPDLAKYFSAKVVP